MLLAIDTSAGTGVAVVDLDGRILAEHSVDDTMRHAEVIGGLLVDALATAGVTSKRITGVAIGMGPGPFTGLRVGIAAARSFAFGVGVPTHPVVSHDAIALGSDRAPEGLLVVTDARRRERYWSVYRGVDARGVPLRVEGPALSKPDDIGHTELLRLDAVVVSAGAVGRVAALALLDGRPPAVDEPLYLRSPDVTLSAGPKRVTA